MSLEDAVISTLKPKEVVLRQAGSPDPVILLLLTTVLRALVLSSGPGHCCQELSCCCDRLSSLVPQNDLFLCTYMT